jgi:type IV secretion system protein VirD4
MTSNIVLGWDGALAPSGQVGFVRPVKTDAAPTLITDTSEGHMLVVAPTGAGKGVNIVCPNLLHYDGSAVVIDVKGELYDVTADYRRRVLGQQVIALDPFGVMNARSGRFNPFDAMAGKADVDEAYSFASLLRDPRSQAKDPFWEERAETLIAGALGHLLTLEEAEQRTPHALWSFLNQEDTPYRLAVALDQRGADMPGYARDLLAGFINIADVTRSGILSTAQSCVRVFASEEVNAATSTTDFSLADFAAGKPMTIYLIMPPYRLRSHSALLRCWVSALLSIVTRRTARPERPTLFVLDELGQLGTMEEVRVAVTLLRGYGMRVMMLVQSHAQLRRAYSDYETLIENCGVIATFGHNSRSMSVQMADALGDVSADALFRMKPHELALKLPGQETRLVRRLNYLSDRMFAGRFTPNRMYAAPGVVA